MTKMLHDLFFGVTRAAAVAVALALSGLGLRGATESLGAIGPGMAWSGTRVERHLIGCPDCRSNSLSAAEHLRRCPELAGLQRQVADEMRRIFEERFPDTGAGPAPR